MHLCCPGFPTHLQTGLRPIYQADKRGWALPANDQPTAREVFVNIDDWKLGPRFKHSRTQASYCEGEWWRLSF